MKGMFCLGSICFLYKSYEVDCLNKCSQLVSVTCFTPAYQNQEGAGTYNINTAHNSGGETDP